MRLESAHIKNFKLLENVTLRFSNDLLRPLTVIRAENGSGKTSILYALRWAMYGERGLPAAMRLTSTANPAGQPVQVQVRLDFNIFDSLSDVEQEFCLIRTCQEIPGQGDEFERRNERIRLLQHTEKGAEEIEIGSTDGLAETMVPYSLADLFFTNGDDVQGFITSGQHAETERQEAVHKAIRHLLELEDVEIAEKHLNFVSRKMKRALAKAGGEKLISVQKELEQSEELIAESKRNLSKVSQRISEVDLQIRLDERELDKIKGVGDLDAIQARIHELEEDIKQLIADTNRVRREIREYLRSEDISKSFFEDRIWAGFDILQDLADRNVIPGTSIEVLRDRLQLGICICGEKLDEGHVRYGHVQSLIDEQRKISQRVQRLTALWHDARSRIDSTPISSGKSPLKTVALLMDQITSCRDRQRQKESALKGEREKREHIDEELIQNLTQRLQSSRQKRSKLDQENGEILGRIHQLEEQYKDHEEAVELEKRQVDLSKTLRRRSSVAEDLVNLTHGTLARLKSIYVQRVSSRMNELFLEIVGADPNADGTVFTGVSIDEEYDIIIHTREGRTLNADTELNGASQRALTLSFIWALMEVAERQAPRIIDTPLGMVSGAVKRRMVDILTKPVRPHTGLPYQVVLFMTRSEIRDIERLISERAGVISTLTCSKDYPVDLMNDWGAGLPIVRLCECNLSEVCPICERRQDAGRFSVRRMAV